MNYDKSKKSCSSRPILQGENRRQNRADAADSRMSAEGRTEGSEQRKDDQPSIKSRTPSSPSPLRRAEGEERVIGSILLLCIVLSLSLMLTIRASRFIDRDFSENEGIGAAIKTLKEIILSNEEIAAFLGLSGIPADDKKTDPTGKESNEETDSEKVRRDAVAVAVQKYIETHNQREMPSDRLGTFPLNGMITSYFSTRQNPFYQVGAGEDAFEFHSGIDISAAISTDILSYRDGIVSRVTYSKSYGNYLIITHNDELETLYAHCDNILVKEGDTVKEGQHIAVAGSTGRSTARHLHFEIRIRGKAVDPLPYLPGKGAVLG